MTRRPDASWRPAFVLLAAIWGASFLLIKLGLDGLAPIHVALGRMLFGTATLLAILAVRREPLPRDPRPWRHLAVAALLLNAVPFALFAYGETRVSSIVAGILNATAPLLTLPFALLLLPEEQPSRARAAGLLVGFLGVLVVLGPWRGFAGGEVVGSLACLAAATCYGLGFPYVRRFLSGRPESVVALSAAQLACGTVELACAAPFLAAPPDRWPLPALAAVAVLGALGTGVAYILNTHVIRHAGATVASTVTYLVPLFSTLLGVTVLGEPLTWNQPLGGLVVVLGVALSQGRLAGPLRRLAGLVPGAGH